MPQEDEAGHPNFGYTERFKGIDSAIQLVLETSCWNVSGGLDDTVRRTNQR